MGGAQGGETASKLVIHSIQNFLKKTFEEDIDKKDLKKILEKTFLVAQDAIAEENIKKPHLKGMGTTLTAVLIYNQYFVIGNIGDSRTYFSFQYGFKQVSRDHSYIQDYLDSHKSELPVEILNHYGNYVTRIIDGGADKPDIYPFDKPFEELQEGDVFLLCSDGLILDKSRDYSTFFVNTINKHNRLKKITNSLLKWAYNNGSDDNISIIIGLYGKKKYLEPYNGTKFTENQDDYKTIVINRNPDKGNT